jgi:hypothetical protein
MQSPFKCEIECALPSKEHFLGPVPSSVCGARQYVQVKVKGFVQKTNFRDSCILNTAGHLCVILNILEYSS